MATGKGKRGTELVAAGSYFTRMVERPINAAVVDGTDAADYEAPDAQGAPVVEDGPPVCPMCDNDTSNIYLGRLGRAHIYFRCRACGWDFPSEGE